MMQLEEVKRIYLPGRGAYDVAQMQVHRAVQQYDERLAFGRNMDNGDWVVFTKMPRGHKPEYVPVLGFGRGEMPNAEEVLRRVDRANTRKFSKELLQAVTEDNERAKSDIVTPIEEENREAFAEIMDYAYRQEGVHPIPKIYVPRSI